MGVALPYALSTFILGTGCAGCVLQLMAEEALGRMADAALECWAPL